MCAPWQEWYKTMADMPAILRQAAQMGLFSSAALVRFLSMDVRPNVTRFVTRSLPPAVSASARWLAGWVLRTGACPSPDRPGHIAGLRPGLSPEAEANACSGLWPGQQAAQQPGPGRPMRPSDLLPAGCPFARLSCRCRARWWAA